MAQWTERDRELVNSSLHPPHSGPLHLLWAVHVQSLDGPAHKPAGSSLGHSEQKVVDLPLPCDTSYTQHICRVTVSRQGGYMCRSTSASGTSTWYFNTSHVNTCGWCCWTKQKEAQEAIPLSSVTKGLFSQVWTTTGIMFNHALVHTNIIMYIHTYVYHSITHFSS